MRRTPIIHPLLCGAFPVLSVLSTNIHQVPVGARVLGTALTAAALSGTGSLALGAGIRNRHRAALVVSAWALAWVYRVLDAEWLLGQPILGEPSASPSLLLCLAVPAMATALILRLRGDAEQWTRIANVTAAILVALPLLRVGQYQVQRWEQPPAPEPVAVPVRATRAALPVSTTYPDIYYIILDRYASASTLAESYGFDNHEFVDHLRARGFYVAEESRSNYLKTSLSLASSLNMGFLDDVASTMGPDTDDLLPVYRRLQNPKAWRFLKARGYRYIHVGGLFEPTQEDPYADENYNATPKNLVGTPFLASCLDDPSMPPTARVWWTERQGIRHWISAKYEFHQLLEISRRPERKFVFAHILVPHSPYIFDRNGRFSPSGEMPRGHDHERYIEQLRYANSQAKLVVDALLANSSHPPVILLQSDEGPFPARYDADQIRFNWHTATTTELRMKTGILNAYFIPGAGRRPALYPSITPVNSFRLVFNSLFGAGFPLLPDRVSAFRDGKHFYDFFDITHRVRGPQAPLPQTATRTATPPVRATLERLVPIHRSPDVPSVSVRHSRRPGPA